MMKYILTLILGILAGGAFVFFFVVGAPSSVAKPPGIALRPPEAGGDPAGTVVLTLDEDFFNTLLGTVFREMSAPTFRLASSGGWLQPADRHAFEKADFRFFKSEEAGVNFLKTQGGCPSQIVVSAEGSGVKTGVKLADGQIVAPLAFSGSYNTFGQCLNFRGWAQADIQLRFEQSEQTLYGQINVQSVNLDGVSPLLGGLVTGFVQNSINQRVNPLVLMRGQQIGLSIPVQASNGTLKAQAREIRSEIKDGALRLHITYDFKGEGGAQAPAPPQG